jgi:nicotinamide phosphoribosyltransferase
MIAESIMLQTDSYKLSHWKQYPPKTQRIYSYFESRGGEYPETVFFGLQYYLKLYLAKDHFVNREQFKAIEKFAKDHGEPFNSKGWHHILNHHDGKLPISIRAIPEGTIVSTKNVLMTVENTCDKCYWLTNYLETMLVRVWYPTTVATQSRYQRQTIRKYLRQTAENTDASFKLHDFGARGSTSSESSAIGGAAHLTQFKGTDNLEALVLLNNYYNEPMAGFSIPAAEHSTITSWGRKYELDAYRNMLRQYPTGTVAVVSDSYNIFKACEMWGGPLAKTVIRRNGVLVIRPDSGPIPETIIKILYLLCHLFTYTYNEKGYKVLDSHIRIIQGDGVNKETIRDILTSLERNGFSAENISFGSGGALLQMLNRDTCKFAFKCSAAKVNGKWRDVWKKPITDPGKNSKRGKLCLYKGVDNHYYTAKFSSSNKAPFIDELVEVFRNGEILKEYSFKEIRKRAME